MMKFLTVLLTFFCGYAHAQLTSADISQGRYLENTLKDKFVGTWAGSANGSQLKITVNKKKRYFKRGNADMYLDFLIVKVNRFDLNGNDIRRSFKKNMELVSIGVSNTFIGINKDPISNNNVRITLEYIADGKLKLYTALPEIDPYNYPEKGFVLRKEIELIKQIE
jgi:hypothetical protein